MLWAMDAAHGRVVGFVESQATRYGVFVLTEERPGDVLEVVP